jgi:hypothetical protein
LRNARNEPGTEFLRFIVDAGSMDRSEVLV